MSIVGRSWLDSFSQTSSKSPLTKWRKKKKKKLLENNSPKLVRNDFVQRDIPINYSMPSPLNSPFFPSSLPSVIVHFALCLLYWQRDFFSPIIFCASSGARTILCVCVGREVGGRWFFFSFHFSFRHVQSALLLFFFFLFRRSFSLLRSCVFPSIHPPPPVSTSTIGADFP